jgi:hypothetical protein
VLGDRIAVMHGHFPSARFAEDGAEFQVMFV